MNGKENLNLVDITKEIRKLTIQQIADFGVGHVGGCLSVVEALVVIYYKFMNIDPKNPKMDGRDRLVLSKGHAGPTLYSILAKKGYFDICELKTLNQHNTNLPSHCDMHKTIGVDMSAGSLGQGYSCSVGMAYAAKLKKENSYVFSIMGDGEAQEGQIWEAALSAAKLKLDNLISFIDFNKYQLDGSLVDVIGITEFENKFKSFGYNTISIDGHDVVAIEEAINQAKNTKNVPTMIILNTIKGKGVKSLEENGANNHSMPISKEECEKYIKEVMNA